MTTTIRLAKRLAEQLQCSRSTAEQYIEGGWVSVDGQVVELPGARVAPQQRVELAPDASLLELTKQHLVALAMAYQPDDELEQLMDQYLDEVRRSLARH